MNGEPSRVRARRGALILLVSLAGLLSCVRPRPAPQENLIAATIAPMADLAGSVAGPGRRVVTIVPPGTSAHVFEPTPRDVRRIAPARLIVTVGAGYDGWARKLAAACAPKAVLHDGAASVGIAPEAETDDHENHVHDDHDAEHDPHWWLSPVAAAAALQPLAERLSLLDPQGASAYRARAAAARDAILRLDVELRDTLAPVKGRAFIAAHPAWPHFAARYGLRPVGSVEPVPGREPSPLDLKRLIGTARSEGLTTIFTEPQYSQAAANAIATDAALRVVLVDPIGGVAGRMTYAELMRFNAKAFRAGLAR